MGRGRGKPFLSRLSVLARFRFAVPCFAPPRSQALVNSSHHSCTEPYPPGFFFALSAPRIQRASSDLQYLEPPKGHMPKGHRDGPTGWLWFPTLLYFSNSSFRFHISFPNRTAKVNDVVHHMKKATATVFLDMRTRPPGDSGFAHDGPQDSRSL